MSDEKKNDGTCTLVIQYNPKTKSIHCDGPLPDTMFCLGLLEMAKVVVLEFRDREAKKTMASKNGHDPITKLDIIKPT